MKWPPPFTPPDAGASYLGTYGLANIWVAWIVGRAPELAAVTPAALRRPRAAPPCPACQTVMVFRVSSPTKRDRRRRSKGKAAARRRQGGACWKCYRHKEPIVVSAELATERAPDVDVLAKVGNGAVLDYVYADDGTGRARWIVLEDGKETRL
jgi:hypothetical protein